MQSVSATSASVAAAPAGSTKDHWNQHARQWNWVASPLRPATEDVAIAASAVQQWSDTHQPASLSAVLLGVTPELARMPWPVGTQLLAVDRSEPMIHSLWPEHLPRSCVVCGNWQSLPLPAASQQVVIGDGCFVLLDWPATWQAVLEEVHRVLKPGGLFIMRYFLRPEVPETVDEVFAQLHEGRIGNFHAFKWRLAAALHGTLAQGVGIADVWQEWHTRIASPAALAEQLGWPLEVVNTINNYREAPARYTFPTLVEARQALSRRFHELSCTFPGYELGDRCPTFIMERT